MDEQQVQEEFYRGLAEGWKKQAQTWQGLCEYNRELYEAERTKCIKYKQLAETYEKRLKAIADAK